MRVGEFLRPSVSPRASPREGRKDLTISTLIAECEEYVQTDKFTKDLSHELVTLFKAEKPVLASPPAQRASSQVVSDPPLNSAGSQAADGRPPRIPDTMRTRSSPKLERSEKIATPKFPLALRGSTYDNVGESEAEDEGIENDYSDDSGASSGPVQCNQCLVGGCSQHESSPALTNTSEGYDSAQESGEEAASASLRAKSMPWIQLLKQCLSGGLSPPSHPSDSCPIVMFTSCFRPLLLPDRNIRLSLDSSCL